MFIQLNNTLRGLFAEERGCAFVMLKLPAISVYIIESGTSFSRVFRVAHIGTKNIIPVTLIISTYYTYIHPVIRVCVYVCTERE